MRFKVTMKSHPLPILQKETYMKILFVFDTFNSGGAGRQFAMLCKGLQERGIAVRIVVIEGGYYYRSFLNSNIDILKVRRRFRRDISPWYTISKEIYSFRPDIVHVWGWMSSFSTYLACKQLRIPLFGSLRTATLPQKSMHKTIAKLKPVLFDKIISNSKAGLIKYGISSHQGCVVYNGFDMNRIPSAGKHYDMFTVVMAARMCSEKDWNCLVDAIGILHQKSSMPKIQFVGLGDGPDRKHILHKGKAFIDSGILQLPGFSKEPMTWMLNANIGVLVSSDGVSEGTSNSILEYMACSLPVICTGTGGNLETIESGTTGWFIEAGDSKALAEVIESLYNNQDIAILMGKAGYQKLVSEYTLDEMISSTICIYRSSLYTITTSSNG